MALRTDYRDDIFSGNRKYSQIDNGDGTISFTDETQYDQVGDSFGATQINEIDGKINGHDTNISNINTNVSNINTRLTNLSNDLVAQGTRFYFDTKNGKWGWNSSPSRGADTFHPFNQIQAISIPFVSTIGTSENANHLVRTTVDIREVARMTVENWYTNSYQYGRQRATIALSVDGVNFYNIWDVTPTATSVPCGTWEVTNYNFVKFEANAYGAGIESGFHNISLYN
jgi:hypothetical protein